MRKLLHLLMFTVVGNGRFRYYVLRDDMLRFYVHDLLERLSIRQEHEGWEASFILSS
jgi:hypothetical protein